MDRLGACGEDGDADRLLVLFYRRRRAALALCALYPRPGFHPGTGVRSVRLWAQSLFRVARPRGSAARRMSFRGADQAVISAAKPRSRSAIRSSTSSRPIWRRTVGPAGVHLVAVRMLAQSKG